jgi:hypothetical protein
MGYRLAIVQKLLKSFYAHAALVAHFSEFDPITLTVQTTFSDVKEQLDRVEAAKNGQQTWRRQTGIEWTWLPPQSSGDDPEGLHQGRV